MGLILEYEDGQTPLTEDEKEGLLIKTITTIEELNEHEQLNIEKAIAWTLRSRFKKDNILSEKFIKELHRKMLGNVWSWAGKFRKSERNIGVRWFRIETDLRMLLDDTIYWIDNKTFVPEEIAIRFKHRLVQIHCFANGNGRHSRIMADIIMESIFKLPAFSWHQSYIVKADEVRRNYIEAIQHGDRGDIGPLINFAKK